MQIFTAIERAQVIERLMRWSATGAGDILDLVDQALTVIRSDPTPHELRQALRFYEYVQKLIQPTLNTAALEASSHSTIETGLEPA